MKLQTLLSLACALLAAESSAAGSHKKHRHSSCSSSSSSTSTTLPKDVVAKAAAVNAQAPQTVTVTDTITVTGFSTVYLGGSSSSAASPSGAALKDQAAGDTTITTTAATVTLTSTNVLAAAASGPMAIEIHGSSAIEVPVSSSGAAASGPMAAEVGGAGSGPAASTPYSTLAGTPAPTPTYPSTTLTTATAPASSSSAPSPPSSVPVPPARGDAKKGVAYAGGPTVTNPNVAAAAGFLPALNSLGTSWYYTWGYNPLSVLPEYKTSCSAASQAVSAAGIEAVPMFWDLAYVDDAHLGSDDIKGASTILAFNEPVETDMGLGQAVVPVAKAVAAWPKLRATGKKLGSPAPAHTNLDDQNDWFVRFMAAMEAAGQEVDFICLHFYDQSFDVNQGTKDLKDYITSVHQKYNKPVWVTEYAQIRFDAKGGATYPDLDTQAAFAKASSAMLEGLDFVERYAWFKMDAPNGGPNEDMAANWNLVDTWYGLTSVGKAYQQV